MTSKHAQDALATTSSTREAVFPPPSTSLRVYCTVWDLLPAGKLSTLAYYAGVGVYHSAIAIDNIGIEWAFGGHPVPNVSGIFGLPAPEHLKPNEEPPPPMPGLRFVARIDMGFAFADEWKSSLRSGGDDEAKEVLLADRGEIREELQAAFPDIDVANVHGRDLEVLRVLRVVEEMKNDADWHGTSYHLLERNCNTFSNELAFRLTGHRVPSWINRASKVALAFPCVVPPGWVNPPEAPDIDAPVTSSVLPVPPGLQGDHDYSPAEMKTPSR